MPDLGEASVFYAARPAITIAGADEPELAAAMTVLVVEETTEGLYRCEATFGNWGARPDGPGFTRFDRDKLEFGQPVTIEIGSETARGVVFDGRITGLEAHFPLPSHQPTMTVLAEDRLQDFRMTRRTRTFEEATDSQVFNAIASEHELTAQVDVDGPTYPVLAQVNQSDLAFIRDRARAIDAEVWVASGQLRVQARGRRRATEEPVLTYRQGLRELVVCADVAGQRTGLSVAGWDVAAKEGVSHEAGESAITNELNNNESGLRLLEQKFGERTEVLVHAAPFDLAEARALAEASCRRMARRFVTGHGVAEGDARLRVGTVVRLVGVGPLFSGKYYLVRVRHCFDQRSGYRTAIWIERPGIGEN